MNSLNQDALSARDACYECLKKCKRDIRLEPIIIKDPIYAYTYAKNIIKGRWLEAESIISTNTKSAYYYADRIIEGRWKQAEDIISTSSYYSLLYSVDVIKGKLPENMHNAMLIYADEWAKEYFDFIKNNLRHGDTLNLLVCKGFDFIKNNL